MSELIQIVMPKWGLSMEEGTVSTWNFVEGDAVPEGAELADIETSKLLNSLETKQAGTLLRIVAEEGETLPCGALIAVMGEAASVGADEIDEFIAKFQPEEPEAEEDQESDTTATLRTTEVNGITLRYAEAGTGDEVVLMLHGFGGDLTNWMFVESELAADYCTITLDLPGHGGSDKVLPGSSSISDLAELVLAFIEKEQLGQVHLVGHSLGGAVANQVAKLGTARSLTLIAPLLAGAALDRSYMSDFIAVRRKRELRDVLTRLVFDPTAISREMVEDVLRFKRIDGVANGLEMLAESSKRLADEPSEATAMPALAIWGKDDAIIAPPNPDMLSEGMELHVIESCGHLPHLEMPAKMMGIVRAHLAAM